MWDLPGPGLEPASPALAGGFLTTAPPGKPDAAFLKRLKSRWHWVLVPAQESGRGACFWLLQWECCYTCLILFLPHPSSNSCVLSSEKSAPLFPGAIDTHPGALDPCAFGTHLPAGKVATPGLLPPQQQELRRQLLLDTVQDIKCHEKQRIHLI